MLGECDGALDLPFGRGGQGDVRQVCDPDAQLER